MKFFGFLVLKSDCFLFLSNLNNDSINYKESENFVSGEIKRELKKVKTLSNPEVFPKISKIVSYDLK